MAVYSSVLQLVAAVSSLTFVLVTGVEGLLGLGPAIFLTASALAAMPAGRAMDRVGRKPVIAGGLRPRGGGLRAHRAGHRRGLDAARDPRLRADGRGERDRAAHPHRGGRHVPARAPGPRHLLRALRLRLRRDPRPGGVRAAVRRRATWRPTRSRSPWLAAGGISLVALGLVLLVRPDPQRIAEAIAGERPDARPRPGGAACARSSLRPGVRPGDADGARQLRRDGVRDEPERLRRRRAPPPRAGLRVPDHRRARVRHVRARARRRRADRPDRAPARAGGRAARHGRSRRSACCGSRASLATAILLFGLGVGWNLSFVAATAQLSDLTSAVRARQGARLQRPALRAAGRGARAARRLRAGLDRRRGARPRRHRDRRRAGALAAAGLVARHAARARAT